MGNVGPEGAAITNYSDHYLTRTLLATPKRRFEKPAAEALSMRESRGSGLRVESLRIERLEGLAIEASNSWVSL